MNDLIEFLKSIRDDRRAVTALEYGLIAALIAVFIIGAVSSMGSSISSEFSTIASAINGA